mgnify:CR=1 FL=1
MKKIEKIKDKFDLGKNYFFVKVYFSYSFLNNLQNRNLTG